MKSPLRSIKVYCIDCSGGMKNEVRLCPITDCPLYSYRTGHRPEGTGKVKRKFTDEQRKAIGARLQKGLRGKQQKKEQPE